MAMENVIILPNCQEVQIKLDKQSSHSLKGADLLDAFFNTMGLASNERQYFGLLYCDKEDGRMDWLDKDEALKSLPKNKISRFHLAVRYYPQHPDVVSVDSSTRKLFCFQVKDKLLRGDWGCDVENHALMDGLLVQAHIGDYNPRLHKPGYLRLVKEVELVAPSRMNSDADPSEGIYLRRVGYYHRSNVGMAQSDAEIMYLRRAKTLALYGLIIHTVSDKNSDEMCIGLREKSIAIFDNPSFAHSEPLMIKSEFSWDSLKYCTNIKNKVKLGVEVQKGKVMEFSWKVRNKNSFKGAERLCSDIKAFRDMYASRDESDFITKKKDIRRVKSFTSPSPAKSRPKFQRLNSVTSTLRNSLRRKKKPLNESFDTPDGRTGKNEIENQLENSSVGLVGKD